MTASPTDPAADAATSACWRALSLLAERVRDEAEAFEACSMLVGDPPEVCLGTLRPPSGVGWKVSLVLDDGAAQGGPPPEPGESRYQLDDLIVVRRLAEGALPPAAAELVELYLPYCLAPLHARRVGRPFTVSHFAQSLDGRIATDAGDSRWIGCPENRVHAHRMRALCDGILIGAHTLRTDRPALTVRHAEGPDPARIVVGGAVDDDIGCLQRAGPSPILLIGGGGNGNGNRNRTGSRNGDRVPESPMVEHVAVSSESGPIGTAEILGQLYRRGILSVYIEGGATTTSAFLAESNIDVLQLHISPMIMGPGINSFSGPTVRSVAESVRFGAHVYRPMGDGMMFVGRVTS